MQGGFNNQGTNNAFVGWFAGYNNTSGGYNTFMGGQAGANNTTANYNVFIGNAAGYTNSTGNDNTFVGTQSGGLNSTGNGNTFIGRATGFNSTTASYNTFVGTNTGFNNTTGLSNVFMGWGAGYRNTAGSYNVFIGPQAGDFNDSGSQNVFVGQSAGASNTVGVDNTFLGTQSGAANKEGNANTLIGKGAGYGNTTGSNNTFVGRNAGFASVTGSNNIFLGNESIPVGPNAGNLQNTVAIGVYAKVAVSDAIVLGDTANANIKVGIGTAAPRYPLDVKGNINIRRGSGGVGKLLFASRSSIATDELDYLVLTGGKPGESGLRLSNLTGPITDLSLTTHVLAADDQGRVGRYRIGVEASQVKLQVASAKQWPDHIFEPTYRPKSLDELRSYIDRNRHLPGYPSASEMEQQGATIDQLLINNIRIQEEQTLYLLELKSSNDQLKHENKQLAKELNELKAIVNQLLSQSKENK